MQLDIKITQKERILMALRQYAATGVTNRYLNDICFRYAARINELRHEGHQIEAAHAKGGLWVFYYRGHTA